jgi:hypothetical protein
VEGLVGIVSPGLRTESAIRPGPDAQPHRARVDLHRGRERRGRILDARRRSGRLRFLGRLLLLGRVLLLRLGLLLGLLRQLPGRCAALGGVVEAVPDREACVRDDLVPVDVRSQVVAVSVVDVHVVADAAEARDVPVLVERLESMLLGEDHLRDLVLVADRLEQLPGAHVLGLGPGGPVLLVLRAPLLLDVRLFLLDLAVRRAGFAAEDAVLEQELAEVVDLDADGGGAERGSVVHLVLGVHEPVDVPVSPDHEVDADEPAVAHQRPQVAQPRGVVQDHRALGRLLHVAEAAHRVALAGAEAHGQRGLAGDLPLLGDVGDAVIQLAARGGALRPAIVHHLELQLHDAAFAGRGSRPMICA